jgi:hypothetical protein
VGSLVSLVTEGLALEVALLQFEEDLPGPIRQIGRRRMIHIAVTAHC